MYMDEWCSESSVSLPSPLPCTHAWLLVEIVTIRLEGEEVSFEHIL